MGCMGRLGVGDSVAEGSAGGALRGGLSLYLHARHADAMCAHAFYVVCMHVYALCLVPYLFLGSPRAGPCNSWPSSVQIPSCQIPSLLTPAVVGPYPSCPWLHPTLRTGHGHDLGVPLPAEYQILCGNQAPGFIIDIHTGKPIGE